jgi:hypothetical protein
MSPESLRIIEEILRELNLHFEHNENSSRKSIYVIACEENTNRKVYFNIPKIKSFVFQLLIEKESISESSRDQFAECLRKLFSEEYPTGGGSFGGKYLTIYLPKKRYIAINIANKELIKKLIELEIKRVCEALKKCKGKINNI